MKKRAVSGKSPILTLLHLARLKGWKAQLEEYRRRKASQAAKPLDSAPANAAAEAATDHQLSPLERTFALELARKSIASAASHTAAPEVKDVAPSLAERKACFVTLTRAGALRGCVGHLLPRVPLYQAVIENARNAALYDPRFAPVEPGELDELLIEISVLTRPAPLSYDSPEELLRQLHPGQDGVLFQVGPHLATFLPRVWTQIPDKVEFLDRLAEKAGCLPAAWRDREATVSVYHAESFAEREPALPQN